jgi:hypothetical protein
MKKNSSDQEICADRRQFTLTAAAGSAAFLSGCLAGGGGSAIADTPAPAPASVLDWNLADKQ